MRGRQTIDDTPPENQAAIEEFGRFRRDYQRSLLDEMMGMGRDLWKSDEEFDQFVEDIRRRRHGLDSASREDLIKELAMRDAKRQTARPSKGSRRRKSVDELAKEQGFKPLKKLEDVLGKGKHLWKSDKEFKEFLAGIYEQRRKDCDS